MVVRLANEAHEMSRLSLAISQAIARSRPIHDDQIGQVHRKYLLLARGQANKFGKIPEMGEFVTADTPDLWRAIPPCK